MPFHGILAPSAVIRPRAAEPDFFADLHLDEIVSAVTAGRESDDLRPFFHTPVPDVATVRYRHAVLRDLERADVRRAVEDFADALRTMRARLDQAGRLHHRHQRATWFRDAVECYCAAVVAFADRLAGLPLASDGLLSFREHLAGYRRSAAFVALAEDTRTVGNALRAVRYRVRVDGGRVTVSRYHGDGDYGAAIERTFAKFRQTGTDRRQAKLPEYAELNHVEEQILDLVARLHPDVFAALDDYCVRHHDYPDETIAVFDREVQFYLAYLAFLAPFISAGLPVCHPTVGDGPVAVHDAYDLALAAKLVPDGKPLVCNDFTLDPPERVLVVTGPNQGGKTTFARMVGQLHHLAALGLPVPARDARLPLADRVFTHFEREEDIGTLRGKLEDELVRVRDILDHATAANVLVLNESFGSTTLHDARFLGTQVLRAVLDRGSIAVYVTFVDELSSLDAGTVSMVAAIDPADPARRTFRILRRQADGLAYAAAIAAKYGLSYDALRERVTR